MNTEVDAREIRCDVSDIVYRLFVSEYSPEEGITRLMDLVAFCGKADTSPPRPGELISQKRLSVLCATGWRIAERYGRKFEMAYLDLEPELATVTVQDAEDDVRLRISTILQGLIDRGYSYPDDEINELVSICLNPDTSVPRDGELMSRRRFELLCARGWYIREDYGDRVKIAIDSERATVRVEW